MVQYILSRVLAAIPVFLIVTAASFFLLQLTGADAAVAMGAGEATDAQIEALREENGLNRPVIVQYFDWMGGAMRGDLGRSITASRLPVAQQIRDRLVVTAELALIAMIVSISIALPIGVVSAVKRNSIWDYLASLVALLGVSVPGFALAFLALYLFAVQLGWIPIGSYVSFTNDPLQNLRIMIIPGIVLGMELTGVVMRLARSTVLEVLNEDFVRTARAKGLKQRRIIVHHVLRNALLPVLTVVGLQLGILVGGAFVIEVIFTLPGTGRLLVDAINSRDTYVIEGVLLVIATAFIFTNIVVDILYGIIDPRIRYLH